MTARTVWLSIAAAALAIGIGCAVAPRASSQNAGRKESPPEALPDARASSPGNTACLPCHQNLASDSLSKDHLEHDVKCTDCHGSSVAHAREASAGVTADVLFGHSEVKPSCTRCHEHPHPSPQHVAAWAEQHQGQIMPNGRIIGKNNVCTDCHGAHVLAAPSDTGLTNERQAAVELFNGKDLTGWVAEGGATWKVENGMLVGTQGPDNAPGDLFTTDTFRDFELTVTYRIVWPANSGVWFRYQNPGKAYQADILEYPKPVAYSGTIYCPGKLFLSINKDQDLVNRDGWNTLTIRAENDRLRVWLNGIPVAEARDQTCDTGKIGFQIHAGKEFAPMKIIVRRVHLQPLS